MPGGQTECFPAVSINSYRELIHFFSANRLSEPKPLDRETVSTQSVSHLDPEGVVYASFVFFYRGERGSTPSLLHLVLIGN